MLSIVECEYPDPKYRYGAFHLGDNEIGRADKADGGWIPRGKRKALPDVVAAKVMIESAILKARRDEARAIKMLDALRLYSNGTLPTGRKGE